MKIDPTEITDTQLAQLIDQVRARASSAPTAEEVLDLSRREVAARFPELRGTEKFEEDALAIARIALAAERTGYQQEWFPVTLFFNRNDLYELDLSPHQDDATMRGIAWALELDKSFKNAFWRALQRVAEDAGVLLDDSVDERDEDE
jgi:hypothetical protein